ncbi:hypothetical protein GCM10023149_13320 [Mucilaginibacter gynuensis]|uniref:Protease n=1 Tax=Mucilaginibacter gynuensis TaxID=1302236 RepID=A0ABP8G3A0_9SPHI
MKNYKLILSAAAVLALSACSVGSKTSQGQTDSAGTAQTADSTESKVLFAKMSISDAVKGSDSVQLKFTVYNPADTAQQFCKWHTPFEPLMSKYLDVKDESGQEANYKGAMAKRIMPPPADSYIKVKPKDSLSVTVNLLKGYDITKPGKYTAIYVGQNMSGLVIKDSVTFVYEK